VYYSVLHSNLQKIKNCLRTYPAQTRGPPALPLPVKYFLVFGFSIRLACVRWLAFRCAISVLVLFLLDLEMAFPFPRCERFAKTHLLAGWLRARKNT